MRRIFLFKTNLRMSMKKQAGTEPKTQCGLIDEDIRAVINYAGYADKTMDIAAALTAEAERFIRSYTDDPCGCAPLAEERLRLWKQAKALRFPKPKNKSEYYVFRILRQAVTPQKTAALCTLFPSLDTENAKRLLHGSNVTIERNYGLSEGGVAFNWSDSRPLGAAVIRGDLICPSQRLNVPINGDMSRPNLSLGCAAARLELFLIDNGIKSFFLNAAKEAELYKCGERLESLILTLRGLK